MSDGNQPNLLYYGDNLDILRRYIRDESVDLIYLDPPFKSNQDYNVLFKERNGKESAAQIHAFEDTWHWDESAALAYKAIVEAGGKVSQAMQARSYLMRFSNRPSSAARLSGVGQTPRGSPSRVCPTTTTFCSTTSKARSSDGTGRSLPTTPNT